MKFAVTASLIASLMLAACQQTKPPSNKPAPEASLNDIQYEEVLDKARARMNANATEINARMLKQYKRAKAACDRFAKAGYESEDGLCPPKKPEIIQPLTKRY